MALLYRTSHYRKSIGILINTGLEAGVLHAEKPNRFNGFEMICKPLKRLRSRKTPEAPG
jgi:hypothetical protein